MKIKINKFYFWWKGEIKKNNKFKKKEWGPYCKNNI
jgi:hypothetical protein